MRVQTPGAAAAAPGILGQGFLLSLVGHTVRLASSSIRPYFSEHMAGFDLKQAEFAVLSLLHDNPGASQKRLAEAINVSPPNMTAVLTGLEMRGLIQRERHAGDQRVQLLVLTAAGAALYRAAAAVVARFDREACAMLDEGERTELLRLLRKLAGR